MNLRNLIPHSAPKVSPAVHLNYSIEVEDNVPVCTRPFGEDASGQSFEARNAMAQAARARMREATKEIRSMIAPTLPLDPRVQMHLQEAWGRLQDAQAQYDRLISETYEARLA